MSLKIIIGKNKVGKTKYLNEFVDNRKKDDENVILYIPSEMDLRNYMSRGKILRNFYNTHEFYDIETEAPHIKMIRWMQKLVYGNLFEDVLNDLLTTIDCETKKKEIEIKNIIDIVNKDQDDYFETWFKNIVDHQNIINNIKEKIKTRHFFIEDSFNKIYRNAEKLDKASSGSLIYSLIRFLYLLITNKEIDKNNKFILVIDEIEKYLHPEMIFKIAEMMINIANKIEILITTHSPIFLERMFFQHKWSLLKEDDQKKIPIITYMLKTGEGEENNYELKEEKILNKLKEKNYSFISIFTNVLFASKIFLVEGRDDRTFLESIIGSNKMLKESYYTVIECGGKQGVLTVLKDINELIPFKKEIFVFHDEDDLTNVENKKINLKLKENLKKQQNQIYIFKPNLNSFLYEEDNGSYKIYKNNLEEKKKKDDFNDFDFEINKILEFSTKIDIKERIKDVEEKIEKFLLSKFS